MITCICVEPNLLWIIAFCVSVVVEMMCGGWDTPKPSKVEDESSCNADSHGFHYAAVM